MIRRVIQDLVEDVTRTRAAERQVNALRLDLEELERYRDNLERELRQAYDNLTAAQRRSGENLERARAAEEELRTAVPDLADKVIAARELAIAARRVLDFANPSRDTWRAGPYAKLAALLGENVDVAALDDRDFEVEGMAAELLEEAMRIHAEDEHNERTGDFPIVHGIAGPRGVATGEFVTSVVGFNAEEAAARDALEWGERGATYVLEAAQRAADAWNKAEDAAPIQGARKRIAELVADLRGVERARDAYAQRVEELEAELNAANETHRWDEVALRNLETAAAIDVDTVVREAMGQARRDTAREFEARIEELRLEQDAAARHVQTRLETVANERDELKARLAELEAKPIHPAHRNREFDADATRDELRGAIIAHAITLREIVARLESLAPTDELLPAASARNMGNLRRWAIDRLEELAVHDAESVVPL